ncbi:hypothetical protein IM40_08910 [Candidatus Paracaedimonas acanthamoebae]|nr:hypothetical protein IM40_08910 [Candidatus Paracaedimonas acanthamoebae]
MRQAMQFTFQALTKNFKFIPEFPNILFMITFLQIAVFAHYSQHSQRNNFANTSYDIQEEDLQTNQAYEAALKEVLPLFRIYFRDSAKQASSDLQIERPFKSPLNSHEFIVNVLKNNGDLFPGIMDSEALILKASPVFPSNDVSFHLKGGNEMYFIKSDPFNPEPLFVSSLGDVQESFTQSILKALLEEQKHKNPLSAPLAHNIETTPEKEDPFAQTVTEEGINPLNLAPLNDSVSFYLKGGNEMPSMEPDPVNPDPLLGSFREEDQEKSAQEEFLEEEKLESPLSEGSICTISTSSEKKEIHVQTVAAEDTNQKNEPANSPVSLKKEPTFKAFYHYNIPSKSRLLNYWMQLTAPSDNVPQKEIPYREALKEIMFSKKFQPFMNEASWFADAEDSEDTKITISQMHEEAFYDYLRSINWEETEFGTLFLCPQIPGKEDFHQAKEDAFNYAYEMVGRCAPGFCKDEDFIVRN